VGPGFVMRTMLAGAKEMEKALAEWS